MKWANAHFTNGQPPIIVSSMLSDLISEIDAHLAWREGQGQRLAETTFGRLVANDGKLMGRLRAGSGITVSTMQAIQLWVAADRAAVLAARPSSRTHTLAKPSEDRSAA